MQTRYILRQKQVLVKKLHFLFNYASKKDDNKISSARLKELVSWSEGIINFNDVLYWQHYVYYENIQRTNDYINIWLYSSSI